MEILFEKDYLREMYEKGKTDNKKHRYQPDIIRKYIRVIELMISVPDVTALTKYNSLNYEKLKGEKEGVSSVRVNNQYRIEFVEKAVDNQVTSTICNIIKLSNHYK